MASYYDAVPVATHQHDPRDGLWIRLRFPLEDGSAEPEGARGHSGLPGRTRHDMHIPHTIPNPHRQHTMHTAASC